ncbi:hypothetical protein PUW86_00700 [Metamycoplasma hyosynoviae]|uniref:hypothetical protein n=2 Tax=Metamycoplasma hyosynoviae TaxID=29559 RepID=UPI002366ABC6|nr:hypothetical protein [Metamycoplasma hyosynoviae]MDD7837516.1 hypothetical protein [Metamycoplasma hyosynoviae]
MNKTTKIILSTAIPVGVASILIPTIVVASLKSKVKKTEQERKSLNDLNLEVEEYLGKITTEVKDTNIEKYTELFDLIGKTKNVISNKYLKKEDYRKQLLLLKEKFDSFKETINPPTNDTNNNSDNTNNENEEDSNQSKTDKETNPQNENVSAYEQLKIELVKAQKFYDSIKDIYSEIKNKTKIELDKNKEILDNSNLSENKYIEAKNNLIKFIEKIKDEIKIKIKYDQEKKLESKLDENLKQELKEIEEKIKIFTNNLKEIENTEKYKNNIFDESKKILEIFNISSKVNKNPYDIKHKNILLNTINERFKNYKENIDSAISKDKLLNEFEKIKDEFEKEKIRLNNFIKKGTIESELSHINSMLKNINNNNVLFEINRRIFDVSSIITISKKMSEIHEKLSLINIEFINLSNKQHFIEDRKIIDETFKEFDERTELLLKENKNENEKNKYLKYLQTFSEITKLYLKLEIQFVELKNIFKNIENFNNLKIKLINFYNDEKLNVKNQEKIEINTEIRNFIKEYIDNYDNKKMSDNINKINLKLNQHKEKQNSNEISIFDVLEQRKNDLFNKLKKFDSNSRELIHLDELFKEKKTKFEKENSKEQKNLIILELKNIFLHYENIIKDADTKIDENKKLLIEIETLNNKYSDDNKYLFLTKEINKSIKNIKNVFSNSIFSVNEINIILKLLLKTIDVTVKFIDSLPKDINSSKELLKNMLKEMEQIVASKNKSIPEIIKNNYNTLVNEIKNNIDNNNDLQKIINNICLVNEYKNTYESGFSFSYANDLIPNDMIPHLYLFELINEYSVYENKIIWKIQNTISQHKYNEFLQLKMVNNYILYLKNLNDKYKEQIIKYDDSIKRYEVKFNKLIEDIDKLDRHDKIIITERTKFIKSSIDFGYNYVDNIFYKNENDISEMEKLLDLLIEKINEETLTQ